MNSFIVYHALEKYHSFSCRTHMAPTYSAFPFPKALFEKFVRENDGEAAFVLKMGSLLLKCIGVLHDRF